MKRFSGHLWIAFAISLAVPLAEPPTAGADECIPPASDYEMRACDDWVDEESCPNGAGDRSVDYFNDIEAHGYLASLDGSVDGAEGDYLALMRIGNPRHLALDLGTEATGLKPNAEIWAVRVTKDADNRDVTKPAILLSAGVHAQEWIAQETALGLVDWLVRAANAKEPYEAPAEVERVQSLLAEREIWFVVIANPVGREVEAEHGNWGTPVYSEVRKNRQWEPEFVCSEIWIQPTGGGRCWPEGSDHTTGYPKTDEGADPQHWFDPGINVGANFSHGWSRQESVLFHRRLIFDDAHASGAHDFAPEQYDCTGPSLDYDQNCVDEFGVEHGHCVEHWMGAEDSSGNKEYEYGCFVDTPRTSLAGANGCESHVDWGVPDARGILHEHCLEIETSVGNMWIPWECGDSTALVYGDPPGLNDVSVDCGVGAPPSQCPDALPTQMLDHCLNGTLRTCDTDDDCHYVGGGRLPGNFHTTSMDDGSTQAPHWMDVTGMDANLYCHEDGYCAVDDRRTCCHNQYGGQRPFESIEARLLRELVNNVPFRAVVDMHSSANTLKFRCPNWRGGCGVTCDWDEKCLKGVCVTGRTTSCWNTTCPEGMECVSRDWPLLRNPQCRATLVDNAWCGWIGDVCAENESCTYGLCLPKMFSPCDLPCGDGEACCWVMGEETCMDVRDGSLNCGACGNVCGAGTLCKEGLCESWYHVLDVCAGEGVVNCGVDGIDCQDVLWDHENCGSCGIACSDTGECRDGVCIDILEADAYGAGEEEE